MHFAKLTRYTRIPVSSFYNGANTNQELMDFWAKVLFQRTTPDFVGRRIAGPFIYTKSFATANYETELRDAANSLSQFLRYNTVHGFVAERQVYSSVDEMLVRTYIAERPNNMLSALFFMERLTDRSSQMFGAQYLNIIRQGNFVPTEQQWVDLHKTNSWIQHIFHQPQKNTYSYGMTPELR